MAVYQFKCNECERVFEEEHAMKDAPSGAKCLYCNAICKRYYGSMNFVLKGDGWPSKDIKNSTGGQINRRAKKIEDVMNEREKAGMDPGREKPMSDAEFERRKKLNQQWIEGQSK